MCSWSPTNPLVRAASVMKCVMSDDELQTEMATMVARIMCKNTTIYTHLGFMNASGLLPVMSHQSPSQAFTFMYFMSTKKKMNLSRTHVRAR